MGKSAAILAVAMAGSVTKVEKRHSKPVGDAMLEWGRSSKNVNKMDPRQKTPGNFYKMEKKK